MSTPRPYDFKVGDMVKVIGSTTDDAREFHGQMKVIQSIHASDRGGQTDYAILHERGHGGCWFYELELQRDWDI